MEAATRLDEPAGDQDRRLWLFDPEGPPTAVDAIEPAKVNLAADAAAGPSLLPIGDFPIGEQASTVHRTLSPMYKPAFDWRREVAREKSRRVIPEDVRMVYAEAHTLREFYSDVDYGPEAPRLSAVLRGTLAASTVIKDKQSIARWETYSPRPVDWPTGVDFGGRPLAFITDDHVAETFAAMRAINDRTGRPHLAADTCKSTWSHLRSIFRAAVAVRAIERVPVLKWPKGQSRDRPAREMYSDEELAKVYMVLAGDVDLQVAFVLAVNIGARAVDLFGLRWEQFDLSGDRPAVEYTARKTGKLHRVPLARVTVRQVDRWRRVSGLLPFAQGPIFPRLQAPEAPEPEQSRPARSRNARMKRRLARIGLHFEKPWQVARLTCNERLERHAPGAGQFVLGHANTLNSRSYREPSQMIWEAVSTLPQPSCFEVP